jgi:hypothetical protein
MASRPTSCHDARVDRNLLLGLTATLNVAQAELDRAGPNYKAAASYVNKSVAELHRSAEWTQDELRRMAEVQNELVEMLTRRGVDRSGSGGSMPAAS